MDSSRLRSEAATPNTSRGRQWVHLRRLGVGLAIFLVVYGTAAAIVVFGLVPAFAVAAAVVTIPTVCYVIGMIAEEGA